MVPAHKTKREAGRDGTLALRPVLCLLLFQLRKSTPHENLLFFWRENLWLLATFGLY